MKDLRHILIFCAFACTLPACAGVHRVMAEPDSVSLFSYTTADDDGRSGLRFAWSSDGRHWTSIGNGRSYLRCDYSLWGSEKRMLKPEMYRSADGMWHCVWQLHAGGREFGISSSVDLTDWRRQTYFTDTRFTDCVPSSWTRYPQVEAVIGGKSYSGTVAKVAWADVERPYVMPDIMIIASHSITSVPHRTECALPDFSPSVLLSRHVPLRPRP